MPWKFLGNDEGVLPEFGLVQPGDVVEVPADLVDGLSPDMWQEVKAKKSTNDKPAGEEQN